MLDLSKFVDRGVSVKLSGGRQGDYNSAFLTALLEFQSSENFLSTFVSREVGFHRMIYVILLGS